MESTEQMKLQRHIYHRNTKTFNRRFFDKRDKEISFTDLTPKQIKKEKAIILDIKNGIWDGNYGYYNPMIEYYLITNHIKSKGLQLVA